MKQRSLLITTSAFLLLVIVSWMPVRKPSTTNSSIVLARYYAQPDTFIRGVDYSIFVQLTPLDSPANKFQPQMWQLWEVEKWAPLETLINNNKLNGSYPPAAGFVNLSNITLDTGMKLDRYGGLWGSFVAPQGTPFTERSLPETTKNSIYYQFVVTRPIPGVEAGKAIPWFHQTGMGMQYKFPHSIQTLIDSQYLKVTDSILPKPVLQAKRLAGNTQQTKPNPLFHVRASNGKTVSFSLNDFVHNPLHTLEDKITPSLFDSLVTTAALNKKGILNQYVNSNGVPVYYLLYKEPTSNKRYWVVVSFNETSAGHFVSRLEAMVRIKK